MKINVAQIRQAIGERQSFRFLLPVADISATDEHFWLNGNIEVLGEVINNGRFLVVDGKITATARLICTRCLKEFSHLLDIPFSERFSDKAEDLMDDEVNGYSGDEIDIAEAVRETLLLAEPLKAVCSKECLGLCQKCGCDRNINPCSCEQEIIDPRLAALQKLLDRSDS